jgi:hypothetical protein
MGPLRLLPEEALNNFEILTVLDLFVRVMCCLKTTGEISIARAA